MMALTGKGILPVEHDLESKPDDETLDDVHPYLMGVAAGMIDQRNTAKEIVDELVDAAAESLSVGAKSLTSKL
jgi:hypothetical protein